MHGSEQGLQQALRRRSEEDADLLDSGKYLQLVQLHSFQRDSHVHGLDRQRPLRRMQDRVLPSGRGAGRHYQDGSHQGVQILDVASRRHRLPQRRGLPPRLRQHHLRDEQTGHSDRCRIVSLSLPRSRKTSSV